MADSAGIHNTHNIHIIHMRRMVILHTDITDRIKNKNTHGNLDIRLPCVF